MRPRRCRLWNDRSNEEVRLSYELLCQSINRILIPELCSFITPATVLRFASNKCKQVNTGHYHTGTNTAHTQQALLASLRRHFGGVQSARSSCRRP